MIEDRFPPRVSTRPAPEGSGHWLRRSSSQASGCPPVLLMRKGDQSAHLPWSTSTGAETFQQCAMTPSSASALNSLAAGGDEDICFVSPAATVRLGRLARGPSTSCAGPVWSWSVPPLIHPNFISVVVFDHHLLVGEYRLPRQRPCRPWPMSAVLATLIRGFLATRF